jgi:hypothetical protein
MLHQKTIEIDVPLQIVLKSGTTERNDIMSSSLKAKMQFVREPGLKLTDLKQILSLPEQGEAKSQADNLNITDFLFIQQKLDYETYGR